MNAIARTSAESPHAFAPLALTLRIFVYGGIGWAAATIIHEVAHAVALKLLFANSYPSIEFNIQTFGGKTSWNFKGLPMLSKIGELFGKDYSWGIVNAAGHLSTSLISGLLWCQKPQNFLIANPSAFIFFGGFVVSNISVLAEVFRYATHPSLAYDFAEVKRYMGTFPASIFAIGCVATLILGVRKLEQLSKQGTANRS